MNGHCVGGVVDVLRLRVAGSRSGESFEAGQTEAKGLGARPSSGANSGGELGQLTCPFCRPFLSSPTRALITPNSRGCRETQCGPAGTGRQSVAPRSAASATPGTCQKRTASGPTADLLSQTLQGWGQRSVVVLSTALQRF